MHPFIYFHTADCTSSYIFLYACNTKINVVPKMALELLIIYTYQRVGVIFPIPLFWHLERVV